MAEFTPRDEVSDWSIARAHELVRNRLAGRTNFVLIAHDAQASWEVMVAVARSVANILRPNGTDELGPIGLGDGAVPHAVDRYLGKEFHPARDIMNVAITGAQLIGCAARDDYAMVRALAAAVIASDERLVRARLVLRAMLEILATEPIRPPTQEPS